MNKYLMMSAAVMMGTIAPGVFQHADAAINMHTASKTGVTYCDSVTFTVDFNCVTGSGHRYCVVVHQHEVPCNQFGFTGHVPVIGILSKTAKVAVVADISAPVLLHENVPLAYVFSYPFNKVKKGVRLSTFDVWGSTNGTTAFLVASGWQGPLAKEGKLIGPTFSKLDELLKARHKQQ